MKNDISLIPAIIGGSIDYSKGNTVSRVILKNDKLQITLFAVAEGESFEEHTTSKEAIVHILEGTGDFYIKDKWYVFQMGDYFYMPAGLIHAITAKAKFKFLLYLF